MTSAEGVRNKWQDHHKRNSILALVLGHCISFNQQGFPFFASPLPSNILNWTFHSRSRQLPEFPRIIQCQWTFDSFFVCVQADPHQTLVKSQCSTPAPQRSCRPVAPQWMSCSWQQHGPTGKSGPLLGPPMDQWGPLGRRIFLPWLLHWWHLVTLYGLNMVELCETALRILKLPWFDFVQDAPWWINGAWPVPAYTALQ